MEKFRLPITVYIGDTNIEGNVYWTHYFDWAGRAREAFARWAVPNIMEEIGSGLTLITVETNIKHLRPAFLYDELIVAVGIKEIRKASLQLSFDFFNQKTEALIATGWQVITFGREGKLVPIPESINRKAHELLGSEIKTS